MASSSTAPASPESVPWNPRRAEESRQAQEVADSPLPDIPTSVLAIVFSNLPLRDIHIMPRLSKAWRATFTTPSFIRLLGEANPKIIAVVQLLDGFSLSIGAFDFASKHWLYAKLRNLMYEVLRSPFSRFGVFFAHDAGLLCFASCLRMKETSIVVCNPLTNKWRVLPHLDFDDRKLFILQLLVNVTTRHYQVIVVHKDREAKCLVKKAFVYDSTTNLWSKKEEGVAFGRNIRSGCSETHSYDCSTKSAFRTMDTHYERLTPGGETTFHTSGEPDRRIIKLEHRDGQHTYRISEYAREYGRPERFIQSYDSPLPVTSDSSHVINASVTLSKHFLLLSADTYQVEGQQHRQRVVHVRDLVAGTWHNLPALREDFSARSMNASFTCELRWDISP